MQDNEIYNALSTNNERFSAVIPAVVQMISAEVRVPAGKTAKLGSLLFSEDGGNSFVLIADANKFDVAATYNKDDLVRHAETGLLYKAKEAITAGAFTASKWTLVDEEINGVYASTNEIVAGDSEVATKSSVLITGEVRLKNAPSGIKKALFNNKIIVKD